MTLQDFFQSTSHGAIAYSGGVDSSLLVWAAAQYGRDWRAYYVRTVFQPEFELLDAKKIAAECGIPLTILEGDILQFPEIRTNPADRCYHCKHRLFSAIGQQAAVDGCSLLIDGTNASDDEGDRPGMRALRELRVRSPLRECGLTKGDVRQLCREVHLSVWNKPAYVLPPAFPPEPPSPAKPFGALSRAKTCSPPWAFRTSASGSTAVPPFYRCRRISFPMPARTGRPFLPGSPRSFPW